MIRGSLANATRPVYTAVVGVIYVSEKVYRIRELRDEFWSSFTPIWSGSKMKYESYTFHVGTKKQKLESDDSSHHAGNELLEIER